jgi:hypothetical protein
MVHRKGREVVAKFTETEVYMANRVNDMLRKAESYLSIFTRDSQWAIGSFIDDVVCQSDHYGDVQKVAFDELDRLGRTGKED